MPCFLLFFFGKKEPPCLCRLTRLLSLQTNSPTKHFRETSARSSQANLLFLSLYLIAPPAGICTIRFHMDTAQSSIGRGQKAYGQGRRKPCCSLLSLPRPRRGAGRGRLNKALPGFCLACPIPGNSALLLSTAPSLRSIVLWA